MGQHNNTAIADPVPANPSDPTPARTLTETREGNNPINGNPLPLGAALASTMLDTNTNITTSPNRKRKHADISK